MIRIIGILVVVFTLYALLMMSDPQARSLENHINLERRIGEWGVLTLGVGFVIITGGIDLSIGSVVCLAAVGFGLFLENGFNPYIGAVLVLIVSAFIGWIHGVLITKGIYSHLLLRYAGSLFIVVWHSCLHSSNLKNWGKSFPRLGHTRQGSSRFFKRCWNW